MTVVFARGTTEPGNVGVLAGPPFFDALTDMLGSRSVDVIGVDFNANIEGFVNGGDRQGSQNMANVITQTLNRCPNTRLVVAGYDQGGQLIHNAANIINNNIVMNRISSIIIFGDPNNIGDKRPIGSTRGRTLILCHNGDNICEGGDRITVNHLDYAREARVAATFAASRAHLGLGF
ncbi:cutinase [Tricladium varicosporioides]|nr:cutinase [Hymenoscyphus varicosporioides]